MVKQPWAKEQVGGSLGRVCTLLPYNNALLARHAIDGCPAVTW